MTNKVTIFLILFIGIILFCYFENNSIRINSISVKSNKIPKRFNGYRIVQLSDLHSKWFGKNQKVLIGKIKKLKPDIIVFTGDMVDSKRYDEKPGLTLMEEAVKIAPVFYVNGNHELRAGSFEILEKRLKDEGVTVLRDEFREIKKFDESIYILGIDDPSLDYSENVVTEDRIRTITEHVSTDAFKVLLSHRPELFSLYSKYKINLSFTGHAHGGQVRLPLIGGLIAPNQGFLPKYTSGKYIMESSFMIVNRGLGNSGFPLRVFNRPEIISVTLSN